MARKSQMQSGITAVLEEVKPSTPLPEYAGANGGPRMVLETSGKPPASVPKNPFKRRP